jgi:hypothetical protein
MTGRWQVLQNCRSTSEALGATMRSQEQDSRSKIHCVNEAVALPRFSFPHFEQVLGFDDVIAVDQLVSA